MTVRPTLTHAGIFTRDLDNMARFYKEVMGLLETDRGLGVTVPRNLIFLSSDPTHHHQFVLSDGRGANDPSTVNQISFLVKSLDDMRVIVGQARSWGVSVVHTINHGNAWSAYFPDPEDNLVEIYAETPWFVSQPHALPFNLEDSDEKILRETEEHCRKDPSFTTLDEWRDKLRQQLSSNP